MCGFHVPTILQYPDELKIVMSFCYQFLMQAVEDLLLWLQKKQLILLLASYVCHLFICVFVYSQDRIPYSSNVSHHVLSA